MDEDKVIDLPELDEPPKNDYWAPEVTVIDPTPEEVEKGNKLGEVNEDGFYQSE